MKLVDILDSNKKQLFYDKGYTLPSYDINALKAKTYDNPTWIHFGAGNIFRAFPAAVLNRALNEGKYDRGVIVVEGFDEEIIKRAYEPFENLSLLTVLKSDGSVDKEVIGSIVDALNFSDDYPDDKSKLEKYFINPSLQMVSFTITEKGYKNIVLMKAITKLLVKRYENGAYPIAMASMDNCSHNGDKLKEGILAAAKELIKEGATDDNFESYILDESKVSFPWSMIDKITPRPDEGVRQMLLDDGFLDADIIVTNKNTYTAAYVNAEETEYLVMEDKFPNGRPPLDLGGVMFTDKETVDKVEKMKVCTCLNPLHTAMSIYGCLLGYESIYKEMEDDDIKSFITHIGYDEGMKVVVNPGIIKPEDFINQVLTKRLPNPFMPDTPQRISCDTSQKLPIRFGETISLYEERGYGAKTLTLIPLVIAGYLRYLMGVDDELNEFKPSPDPMLDELMEILKPVKIGCKDDEIIDAVLKKILTRKDIFKVDLFECGLDEKIKKYFMELIENKGSVRAVLHKAVSEYK